MLWTRLMAVQSEQSAPGTFCVPHLDHRKAAMLPISGVWLQEAVCHAAHPLEEAPESRTIHVRRHPLHVQFAGVVVGGRGGGAGWEALWQASTISGCHVKGLQTRFPSTLEHPSARKHLHKGVNG